MDYTTPLKILLVDNEPIALRVHHKLLGDLGYFPDTAEDGQKALSLATNDYHVILMNLRLPDLHSTEVAAHIRHRESHSHRAHIVGLTTLCTPEVTADCLAAGMNTVMTKPLTIDKLSRLLAAAMQSTSQRNEPLTQEIT